MLRWVKSRPVSPRTEHAEDDDGHPVVIISRWLAPGDLEAPWSVQVVGDQYDLDTGPLTRAQAREVAEAELTRRTGQAWEPRTGWWPT